MTLENIKLDDLLVELESQASDTLNSTPEVVDASESFTAEEILSSSSNRWYSLESVVAVVFDLKNSTRFSVKNTQRKTTARVYTAAVEGAVKAVRAFQADFVDIQGDGGFGLFWGEKRFERAFAAAVTIRTFSTPLAEMLGTEDFETGFKVGMHDSKVLVKKIGTLRKSDQQEPIWAGRAVNYATKCAQFATAHQVIATSSVWAHLSANDYIAFSCGCPDGVSAQLWEEVTVDRLPQGEQSGVLLNSKWCDTHGSDFLAAILSGERKRDIPEAVRNSLVKSMFRESLERKEERDLQNLRNKRVR